MKKQFAVLAVLLASACGSGSETKTDDAAPPVETAPAPNLSGATDTTASPTNAAGYVDMAGAGDMWEIESSKAVLAKTKNADVKKFAQMMIDNHTQSTAKIKAAATAAKLTITPPNLAADQISALNEIRTADAADIDAVYLRQQRAAHARALALHQGYAAGGDTDGLKKVAAEIVPVVQKHMAEIDRIGRMIPATAG